MSGCSNYRARLGQPISMEDARQLGLDRQVLAEMMRSGVVRCAGASK